MTDEPKARHPFVPYDNLPDWCRAQDDEIDDLCGRHRRDHEETGGNNV